MWNNNNGDINCCACCCWFLCSILQQAWADFKFAQPQEDDNIQFKNDGLEEDVPGVNKGSANMKDMTDLDKDTNSSSVKEAAWWIILLLLEYLLSLLRER